MKDRSNDVSRLILERFVLGELGDEEAGEISGRMAVEPGLAESIAEIKKSDEDILSTYPPERMAGRIRERFIADTPGSGDERSIRGAAGFRRLAFALGGAAAFACILFLLFPLLFSTGTQTGEREGILVKGDVGLLVFRQTSTGYEQLSDGARAHRGERFQVKYRAGNTRFGVIFSIDGRGGLTLHFPQAAGKSMALSPKGDVALLDAFELDDAPGFERFFFVASGTEFSPEGVLAQGRALAADANRALSAELDLRPGLKQVSFTLVKEGFR
jgi:hypothetical protein